MKFTGKKISFSVIMKLLIGLKGLFQLNQSITDKEVSSKGIGRDYLSQQMLFKKSLNTISSTINGSRISWDLN